MNQDVSAFVAVMQHLFENNLFHLLPAIVPFESGRKFDVNLDDATAICRFRFTIPQLKILSELLKLPDNVETQCGNKIGRVEALAMACCSFAERVRLTTMTAEFGRSTSSISRVISHTVYSRLSIIQILSFSTQIS